MRLNPLILLVTLLLPWVARAEETSDLATQARQFFQHYCFECHGQDGSQEGGMDYVTDLSKLVERKKVIPGDANRSKVMKKLRSQDAENYMPPDGAANGRPKDEEIALIERWIAAGSPNVTAPAGGPTTSRTFVSTQDVIATIHNHLKRLDPEDRRFQRYFTLNHLHNQPPDAVSSSRLRTVRAAVSKVLNSLSWRFEIVAPKALDTEQTVLAFDVRDVDWDANQHGREDLWLQLVNEYPYALTHDQYPDSLDSREMAKQIYEWSDFTIPWVRADWFVATASQPPLYHKLLYDAVFPELATRARVDVKLPNGKNNNEPAMTAGDLERWLRVDIGANIRRARAARAGMANSGVSSHSRIVERHPALYGAYWKSYDFGPENPTGNLQSHPLGPPGIFTDPRLRSFEFSHNGGEIIFNLPNGLQGYLLIDANGKRINKGPEDIVNDSKKTIGTATIVNGLSCMACHDQGMKKDIADEVRLGIQGFPSAARDTVRRLYLDPADMKPLVDQDELRFLTAIERAVGPYLRENVSAGRNGEGLDEPVGPVAKEFLTGKLTSRELAFELGLRSPEQLSSAINSNRSLEQSGLAAVAAGASLKRDTWEAGQGQSLFQATAWQRKLGTPTTVVAPRR